MESFDKVTIRGHGVVAVIQNGGRYLMIQRAHDILAGGMWCFVGGAIQTGETQEEALVREVKEEVALDVVPVAKVWECRSFNGEWLLHCWSAKPLGTTVRPDAREVADFKWLTPAEIMQLPQLIPSVKEYLMSANLL